MQNYAGLVVRRVILHEVPPSRKNDPAAPAVRLSQAPTPVTDQHRGWIQQQLRKTLPKHARPVIEDPEAGSAAPALIRGYLDGTARDLVHVSQTLATLLHEATPGGSPAGLLMFVDATLDGDDAVLLAKFEHERGFAVDETLVEGQTTLGMEFLTNLFMTSEAEVYKIGLFTATAVTDGLLVGTVVDRQHRGFDLARYFLERYLGCRIAEDANLSTERFLDAASEWVNTWTDDPEKRTRYEVALLSELQSQSPDISVNRFAAQHLDVEDRDAFVGHMQTRSVPLRDMDKSLGLVEARLSSIRIEGASGVVVISPPERMQDGTVTVSGTEESGVAQVVIRDRLAQIEGGRAHRPAPRQRRPPTSDAGDA